LLCPEAYTYRASENPSQGDISIAGPRRVTELRGQMHRLVRITS